MGRIYCEACGANWRSSGDGPEAQEHHVDVPCVGESTEFKQRAEIAALTEKLRAVEAERDEVKRQNVIFRGAQKACDDCDAPTMREVENMRAQLSALRAELERKDAALKEACAIADRAIRAGYQASGGAIVQKDLGRDELWKCRRDLNAALQPKEPPCKA